MIQLINYTFIKGLSSDKSSHNWFTKNYQAFDVDNPLPHLPQGDWLWVQNGYTDCLHAVLEHTGNIY